MASLNSSSSSSPSPSPYPSESQPGSRPVAPNGGGHAQHASPYTLRPRSVSVVISDRSEAEFDDELLQSQLAQTVEYDDAQQWPLREDDRADGRRRVESDSSDYQPSDLEASPGPVEPEIKNEEEDGSVRMGGIEARPGSNFADRDHGTPSSASRIGHKRSRERTFSTPLVDDNEPQSKRRSYAKAGINMHYLELLEDDMDDARRNYIPEDQPELMTTQIGLTLWTTEEKEMFHEAVGRLGSDDIQGIAARLLGSKSEVEVRHYMHVLKENAETRKRDLRTPLHKPLLSDFPAATEISEACCTALEKTADIISKREDIQEARDEHRKWGPHWLLTGDNCRDLSKAALEMTGMSDDEASNPSPMPTGGPQAERLAELASELRSEAVPALALFDVRTMLLLSERVFMNGGDEDANYMGLGDTLPAIQMSALNDMCALVYTVTQRLAATAMHMCRSRDQAKRHLPHSVKKLVRPRDVRAAVASLGLKKDSRAFWARCPRRLGLNVSRSALPFADMDGIGIRSESVDNDDIDDQEEDESDGDDSEEDSSEESSSDDDSDIFSTYGEVEKELLPGGDEHGIDQPSNDQDQDEEQSDDDSEDESDEESESDSSASDSDEGDDQNKKQVDKVTEQRVNGEADEVINYTASNFPATSWAQASLKNRIRDELKEEEYACAVDSHASKRDELYLWAVLGQKPPSKLGLNKFDENETPHVEGFSVDARRFPVDEVIETGSNWRDRLQYEAEWEASAIEAQEAAKEENEQENGDDV